MVILWFSRPLATVAVAWLSILDREKYGDNSEEIGAIDSIYSFVNMYLFGTVARITSAKDLPRPARMARAGSALWLLGLVLMLFWSGAYGYIVWPGRKRARIPPRASYVFPITLFLHGLWFTACWLLWTGLLFSDTRAFCPTKGAMQKVTVIWLFTPVVDHLWRGFATHRRKEETE
jgi:hypothetical protein